MEGFLCTQRLQPGCIVCAVKRCICGTQPHADIRRVHTAAEAAKLGRRSICQFQDLTGGLTGVVGVENTLAVNRVEMNPAVSEALALLHAKDSESLDKLLALHERLAKGTVEAGVCEKSVALVSLPGFLSSYVCRSPVPAHHFHGEFALAHVGVVCVSMTPCVCVCLSLTLVAGFGCVSAVDGPRAAVPVEGS